MTQQERNENIWIPLAVVAFVLGITVPRACGQTASVGVQPNNGNTISMQDHPQHAMERSIQTDGGVTAASGTLPLSDFLSETKKEVPLGDVARYYRTHSYVPVKENKPCGK